MTHSKRNLLIGTAALALAIGLFGMKNAQAACTVVSNASVSAVTLSSGDCLEVTSTGSITAEPAVSAVFGGAGTLDGIIIMEPLQKHAPPGAEVSVRSIWMVPPPVPPFSAMELLSEERSTPTIRRAVFT